MIQEEYPDFTNALLSALHNPEVADTLRQIFSKTITPVTHTTSHVCQILAIDRKTLYKIAKDKAGLRAGGKGSHGKWFLAEVMREKEKYDAVHHPRKKDS